MDRPRMGSRAGVRADGEPNQIWMRFAIAGAALIAVAGVLTTCTGRQSSGSSGSPDSVFAASTVHSDAIAAWYGGTLDIRQRIVDGVAEVRTQLAAQDGAALRPACTGLGDDVTEARALPSGPDSVAQNLFDAGLDGYGDGVTACEKLFDGTETRVDTLQEQVSTGLTTGDEQWSALATRLSLPMATAGAGGPTSAPPSSASPGTRATTPTTTRPTAARTTRPPTAPRTTPPPVATTPAPPPSTTAAPTTTPTAGETSGGTKPTLPTVGGGPG